MTRPETDPSAVDEARPGRRAGTDVLLDVVSLYVRDPNHGKSEVRAFADLVEGLLDGAGPILRRQISQLLAPRADTPVEIARRLANDKIDIAEEMIVRSPVLTSSDLVEIMRRGPEHVRRVGQRLDLAPDIAAVLVDTSMAAPMPAPVRTETRRRSDRIPSRSEVAAADVSPRVERPDPLAAAATALPPPLFKVPIRPTAPADRPATSLSDGDAVSMPAFPTIEAAAGRLPDGSGFLALDSAGRWRALQAAALDVAVHGGTTRARSVEADLVGDRLFAAAVTGDAAFFSSTLAETLGIARSVAEEACAAPDGETLAILLLACGLDPSRATTILLHRFAGTATLGLLQDLVALLERTPRRTAERLVEGWREEPARRRETPSRQTDPAERREAAGSARVGRTGTDATRPISRTGSN